MTDAAPGILKSEDRSDVGMLLVAAMVYCALGAISFTTAYVQPNAATVWLPTGFAFGLLLVLGRQLWPAVTLGSFILNLTVNLILDSGQPVSMKVLVALGVATGNTFEALLGEYIARKLAHGRDFFRSPRDLVIFFAVVGPLAALASVGVGVSVSWLGGISATGAVRETILTWYVANVAGVIIFTGPTILVLSGGLSLPRERWIEFLALIVSIAFVSQAMSGIYFADFLYGWPRPYMIIPILLWASFRFGSAGAFFSIVIVVAISTFGTFRGFQAFEAETPSRSLIYLQVFLGLLSLMALSVAAALSQIARLQQSLEERVRDRTAEVERLLREKDVFTTVVAHDLQSPLYGVRNALKVTADALAQERIKPKDAVSALKAMEETCAALANRVAGLLLSETRSDPLHPAGASGRISDIVENIGKAHCFLLERKGVTLEFSGDAALATPRPAEVEHILDILIDNAIDYAPPASAIAVAVAHRAQSLEIEVSDAGPGIAPEKLARLFQPQTNDVGRRRNGLGLYLAYAMARALGGDIIHSPNVPSGARLKLRLPLKDA
jgi:signal transduction histidine kinase